MSIRRSAAVILTAGAIAASVLAATPAQASVRVDWDDPLTTKVEKAPKTKISKGEYKRLHKGQSYAKVTRTVHGKGQYIGPCVEGGPCGSDIRWYLYKYRDGKMKWHGEWVPEATWLAFKDGKLVKKFHS